MNKIRYKDNFRSYERIIECTTKEEANAIIQNEMSALMDEWFWIDYDREEVGLQTIMKTTNGEYFASWERLFDEFENRYKEHCEQTLSDIARYHKSGVKQYQILGREEGMCYNTPDCFDMDGKIFDIADCKIGINAPPFHLGCRCCIAPVFDDEFLRQRQEENHKKGQEKRAKQREALRIKHLAKQQRSRAKYLKSNNQKDEAKQLELYARFLEQESKKLFEECNK